MNRDHKVFEALIVYDAIVHVPNPEAPGSGEMVKSHIGRSERVVTLVAPDVVYVKAWLIENPHRFVNVEIRNITEKKIDAVLELHTY